MSAPAESLGRAPAWSKRPLLDNEQIDVRACVGIVARLGAEENDPFRLRFIDQRGHDAIKHILGYGHGQF
jgi:hypothetical protein